MDIRSNHRDLTPAQKTAYVNAVLVLKNATDSVLHPGKQKRYDDFVEVHKNAMVNSPAMFMPMPHGGPLFYPWHRILLRQFELALQAAANDGSVTIPYWDWDLTGPANPFTPDFLGGNGDQAQGWRVTTGAFAYSGGKFTISVFDGKTGDSGLLREFGEDHSAHLPSASATSAGLGKIPYSPGPNSFEVVSEGSLHNPVHRWVGGNMALATSPNDPVFFQHHAYLDKLWEDWKKQHPTLAPYLPDSGQPGYDLSSTLVFNNKKSPAPWAGTWTIQQTLDPGSLGYGYA